MSGTDWYCLALSGADGLETRRPDVCRGLALRWPDDAYIWYCGGTK